MEQPRDDLTAECNCWVSTMKEEFRSCTHCGAHEETCPWYRRSLDPVDNKHDIELRAAWHAGLLREWDRSV
jgi:Fe-S oxidoreductase